MAFLQNGNAFQVLNFENLLAEPADRFPKPFQTNHKVAFTLPRRVYAKPDVVVLAVPLLLAHPTLPDEENAVKALVNKARIVGGEQYSFALTLKGLNLVEQELARLNVKP